MQTEQMERTEKEVEDATETTRRVLPETLRTLDKLRWNYWWSWAADGVAVFRDLDSEAWDMCEHNPHRVLRAVSDLRLMQMAIDPNYTERVRVLGEAFDDYMQPRKKTWAQANKTVSKHITTEHPVAYFCAEYGIHNSLPMYSGGLGMLAGDHLKSASDIGLPLVGVGLLYRYGYFRQRLARNGWQEEYYGEVPPSDLPIELVRDDAGNAVIIAVEMRGRTVYAQAWKAQIGRVPLYLLDTNIEPNAEVDRWVTGHLYGGDREVRIVQELLLGVGGVRLLRRLNVEPCVYHLNEGHSAFLTLELARELVQEREIDFAAAQKEVVKRCVFTTHTPVAAGNDEFSPALIDECLGENYWQRLGLTCDEFLGLGRVHAEDETEAFGMTPLAIKMCRSTNGVSRKHGEVSRGLWKELWSEGEAETINDVPITSVTNGVHAPTWVAPLLRALYEKHVGENWAEVMNDAKKWEKGVAKISDEELWQAHRLLKQRLVAFVRHRSFHSRVERGEDTSYTEAARTMFDPEALTIGFARRVAAYKRWALLLTDPERLHRLMLNAKRPVQFVFAGKAHPQDNGAKRILQQVAQWKLDPQMRQRAVFLENYDQDIARHLVQSVDVWMNVPKRPLEASGTSGQKVGMNGGLNLSVLDGWWIEGYEAANGWAVGAKDESIEAGGQVLEAEQHIENFAVDREDAADADSLYTLLEESIVPCYYDGRDANGIPTKWLKMMRRSIETLAPAFNSDRMVREYAGRIYVNANGKVKAKRR